MAPRAAAKMIDYAAAGSIMFFEGPEKKAEIVVGPGCPSLRSLGPARWEAIVAKSRSKILSRIGNEHCDAYLLSESSLFVFDEWALMLTCGRTTLVPSLLEILNHVPPQKVRSLIYERKNEHFPHLQRTGFFEDARELHRRLPGKAFRFGSQDEHHICIFHADLPYRPTPDDFTLEILMHGINDRAREIFCSGLRHTSDYIRDKTGIREIYPGFLVDDRVFQPQGYSLNAIRAREYYAIHVTPEEAGSYASFETNRRLDADSMNETLDRMLSIFAPQSFDLVLFQHEARPTILDALGYHPRAEVRHDLSCGYRVSFHHYSKRQEAPRRAFEFELPSRA